MKLIPQNQRDGATVYGKLHDPNFHRFRLKHPCDTDRQTDGRTAYMLSQDACKKSYNKANAWHVGFPIT